MNLSSKMKLTFAATAAVILSPLVSMAADIYNYQSLGFSQNGRYFAFTQSVVQDGSGFPSVDVAVVEVATNNMVARTRSTIQDESATIKAAFDQALAKIRLDRFGITVGSNIGQDVYDSAYTSEPLPIPVSFMSQSGKRYSVSTSTKQALPVSSYCFAPEAGQLLKLTLVREEGQKQTEFVLQNDQSLPKVRTCAYSYQVRRVTQLNDKLVVVLSHLDNGFEGADVNFMVVTARIGSL